MIYLPRIVVFGVVFSRQDDHSYTAQSVRAETCAGVRSKYPDGSPEDMEVVPWDMRLDQEWLRLYPEKWTVVV